MDLSLPAGDMDANSNNNLTHCFRYSERCLTRLIAYSSSQILEMAYSMILILTGMRTDKW